MELSKLKSVLIVRRNGLGDAVYTALAIKELKKKYPDIKFAILCSSYTKEIYNVLCPKIKKYVVEKEKYYGNFYGLFFHPILKKIRKEKFDLRSNVLLFDPVINAEITYYMTKGGTDWSAWKGLTSRAKEFYLKFPITQK